MEYVITTDTLRGKRYLGTNRWVETREEAKRYNWEQTLAVLFSSLFDGNTKVDVDFEEA